MTKKLYTALIISLGLIGFAQASDDEMDQDPQQAHAEGHFNNHLLLDPRIQFPGLPQFLVPNEANFSDPQQPCILCPENNCFSEQLASRLGLNARLYNYSVCPDFLKTPELDHMARVILGNNFHNINILDVQENLHALAAALSQRIKRQLALVDNFPNIAALILHPENLTGEQYARFLCKLTWADPSDAARITLMEAGVPNRAETESCLFDVFGNDEIPVSICEFIDNRSLLSLAKVNQRFNAQVTPIVIRKRLLAIHTRILSDFHITKSELLVPLFNPLAYLIAKRQLAHKKVDLDELCKTKLEGLVRVVDSHKGRSILENPCKDCTARFHFIMVGKIWHDLKQEYGLFSRPAREQAEQAVPHAHFVGGGGIVGLLAAFMVQNMGNGRAIVVERRFPFGGDNGNPQGDGDDEPDQENGAGQGGNPPGCPLQ